MALGMEPAAARAAHEGAAPAAAGWVVYWKPEESLRAAQRHAALLDEIAVFAYHFDGAGRIVPASAWVTETARVLTAAPTGERPRVVISIVNDVVLPDGAKRLKDAAVVHDAVRSPQARAAHLAQLLPIAHTADGLELDYENLRSEDREGFAALVRELAQALHAQGRWLSVVVQAKLYDLPFRDGANAMDWPALAQSADRIKVMAYHFHHAGGRPGPIAPPDWVEQLTRFALRHIPREKLCVVLTLHGFDWPHGTRGQGVNERMAMALAGAHQTQPRRDAASGSPWFPYDERGVRHEVWFEDAESLRLKIARLRRAGVGAIGLWHLGAGDALAESALRALSN